MSWPANLRGWGQGWPVDRSADMVWVRADRSGARWQVHREIGPIIRFLVNEVERRGYLFDHGPRDIDDDWGYANRAIRGRNSPSNHSWGLAIDIDAQEYPMGTRRNPPRWIIDLFRKYGFEWGGDWRRPDPMHFEWKGTVKDARWTVAALAAHNVGNTPAPVPGSAPTPTPPPSKEDIMATKDELRAIIREELERSQRTHHDATRTWIREELKRVTTVLTAEFRNLFGK